MFKAGTSASRVLHLQDTLARERRTLQRLRAQLANPLPAPQPTQQSQWEVDTYEQWNQPQPDNDELKAIEIERDQIANDRAQIEEIAQKLHGDIKKIRILLENWQSRNYHNGTLTFSE